MSNEKDSVYVVGEAMSRGYHDAIYDIPSRQCLVCGRHENPDSSTVATDKAWLCETCKIALQKIVGIIEC